MKICQYVPHGAIPDIRGFAPAVVAQNFAKFLKEDTYVISAAESYVKQSENSEYGDVYRIKQSELYKKLFTKITNLDPYSLYARAAKIVQQKPVDIFHAHQLEFPVTEFRKMVAPNTKIVVHAHVTRTFDPKWGKADAYIAVSEYIKNRLIERGFDENLVSVVRNGVNTSLFRPLVDDEKINFKEKFNIPRDAKVVLFAGRKQEIKGFEVFLRSAKKLIEQFDDVFIVAVGPEPKDALKEKTYMERQKLRAQLKNTHRFIDLPPVSHGGLANFFGACDVAVFPSKSEPQGMVMIEAMSCGVGVVSSKTGGIVESIDDGVNGRLANDVNSEDEFFCLIKESLFANNYSTISNAAREKILNIFAWEKVTSELEKVYERILS